MLCGFGVSLFSVLFLENSDNTVSEFTIIENFFLLLYVLGVAVIWPLLAYRGVKSANKSENYSRKKGGIMSLKLYIVFMVFILVNGLILTFMEGA
tara:strand:- start:513 stop:797 length:285 start_codon:yes stop_codon:yes gene_type:complete